MKQLFNDQHMVQICFTNFYLSTRLSRSTTRKFNYVEESFFLLSTYYGPLAYLCSM